MEKVKQRRFRAGGWRKILGRFEDSGLTAQAFCANERISTRSLRRWQLRLGADSGRGVPRQGTTDEQASRIHRFGRSSIQRLTIRSTPGTRRRCDLEHRARLMFFAEAQIRVHLYGQPTDMRKSYDGLQALARHAMGRDPLDGALYVFVNRRGSQIKCLYFDRSGFCIWGKRLETGRFISDWRNVRTREMDWTGLKLLLEGLEGKRVRKRFSLPSSVTASL